MSSSASRESTEDRLRRKLRADLGPEIEAALERPDVTDIMVNGDGGIWVEEGGKMTRVGTMSAISARSVIQTVAANLGQVVNERSPILQAELPLDGERFHGTIPPFSDGNCITIRRHRRSLQSLAEWETQGGVTKAQRLDIQDALGKSHNIVVSGGTGCGKTSFVNALLRELALEYPEQRLLLIEDTPELQPTSPNIKRTFTTPYTDMVVAVQSSLRDLPRRIIIGEVRGREAYGMCMAWQSGHPGGICTVHANSTREARLRLIQLCAQDGPPESTLEQTVDTVLHCVIQMHRDPITGQRAVREVARFPPPGSVE